MLMEPKPAKRSLRERPPAPIKNPGLYVSIDLICMLYCSSFVYSFV
jgi:hypothetical protein